MVGPLAHLLMTRHPVILDGAIGTLLAQRGVDTGLPLWSANALLTAPDVLRRIHEDYIRAGTDIITTATFRTTPRVFRNAGLPDRSAELTALAVSLTQQARTALPRRHTLIAGSMGPLEDCYRPDLVPPDADLRSEHAEHARRLAQAGVDFLFLETIGTIRESYAAAEAARATGKEFMVSWLCTLEGNLYSGEPLNDAISAIAPLAPEAFSINCVSPRCIHRAINNASAAIRNLPPAFQRPLGVYANVGLPGGELAPTFVRDVDPVEYVTYARQWADAGVRLIGGCCGTTPEYIMALALAFPRGSKEEQ